MEEAYEYEDKKGTTKHLDELFQQFGKKNPLFWPKLSEAFWKHGNKSDLSEDDINHIEYLQGSGDQFTSDSERDAFIYLLLSNRIDAELERRSLRNRKFTLANLPLLDNILREWRQIKGIQAKFYRDKIDILTDWLLKIAFEGGFSRHDVEAVKTEDRKAVAKVLVRHYFSIKARGKETNEDEGLLITVTDKMGNHARYLRRYPGPRGTSGLEIFRKGYSYYTQNNIEGKTGFRKFQQYEISRFKAVLQCLSEIDDEYDHVSNYLKRIGPLTEKAMTKQLKIEHSFGISRIDHEDNLSALLTELTQAICFLCLGDKDEETKDAAIADAVAVFTTDNYVKEKREIKFGCETTTVAYILNAINDKFSSGSSFNSYAIGKCRLFFVPTVKKPSEQPGQCAALSFTPLQRDNIAQSLRRFDLYKKDEDKAEHLHYKQIQPIFKRFGLSIK